MIKHFLTVIQKQQQLILCLQVDDIFHNELFTFPVFNQNAFFGTPDGFPFFIDDEIIIMNLSGRGYGSQFLFRLSLKFIGIFEQDTEIFSFDFPFTLAEVDSEGMVYVQDIAQKIHDHDGIHHGIVVVMIKKAGSVQFL